MSRHVVFARAAVDDLESIQSYLLGKSPQASVLVGDAIERAIQLLVERPYAGHARPDLTSSRVLFYPVYRYLLVYRVNEHAVEILRVVHGARETSFE
ncbi:MAG: type II toxin-antitoxin system RelE/ParE family toxin [Phycisphaerae bacterium]